jgi:transcriptional regulator with XRE-family HTH domain
LQCSIYAYEEEEIKRIGMRIKSARALTGFSQSDFCEKYELSVGAFKTWESGKFAPRISNLEELCRCFKSEGVFNVTTSWFLKGEGPAPTHVIGEGSAEQNKQESENPSYVYEEIELFKKNQQGQKRQVIVATILDDLMAPFFSCGDIVGGIRVILRNMPTLEMCEKPFLIETKPNHFIVRWCFSDGKDLFFKSQNDSLLYRIDNHGLGRILWHRRFERGIDL